MDGPRQRLGARLSALFDLPPERAAQVVDEVLDALDQTLDDYIASRHGELQRLGLKNDEIYAQLAREVAGWRFVAPTLSVRQIRRKIYG